jgi:hypothetical protein
MPEEQWSLGLKFLRRPQVFTIEAGMIFAAAQPGLGLEVDEEAIERFRTRGGGLPADHRHRGVAAHAS